MLSSACSRLILLSGDYQWSMVCYQRGGDDIETSDSLNILPPERYWFSFTSSCKTSLCFKTLNQILTTNYIISTFCCWKWMFFPHIFLHLLFSPSLISFWKKQVVFDCMLCQSYGKEGGIRKQWSNPCFLPWKCLKILLLVSVLLVAQPELCCFLKHSC